MYYKEKAIAHTSGSIPDLRIEATEGQDTDQFNNSSGELERPGGMDDVLLAEARCSSHEVTLTL